MAGEVNPIDSTRVATSTSTPQAIRVAEQEEEQMFEFPASSAIEIGYNLAKDLSVSPMISVVKNAIEGEGVLPESTKELIPESVKGFIHTNAEKIREAKNDMGTVAGWFVSGGVIGMVITWLDEELNK